MLPGTTCADDARVGGAPRAQLVCRVTHAPHPLLYINLTSTIQTCRQIAQLKLAFSQLKETWTFWRFSWGKVSLMLTSLDSWENVKFTFAVDTKMGLIKGTKNCPSLQYFRVFFFIFLWTYCMFSCFWTIKTRLFKKKKFSKLFLKNNYKMKYFNVKLRWFLPQQYLFNILVCYCIYTPGIFLIIISTNHHLELKLAHQFSLESSCDVK